MIERISFETLLYVVDVVEIFTVLCERRKRAGYS